MAGTVRPYTFADIIGQLNDQSQAGQGSIVPLQGFFAQPDENSDISDIFTTIVRANPTWDNGQWGLVTWG